MGISRFALSCFGGCSICHRSKAVSLTQITACLIGRPASPCLLLLRCIQRDHIPQIIIALSFAVLSTNKSRAHVSGCKLGSFTLVSSPWLVLSFAPRTFLRLCSPSTHAELIHPGFHTCHMLPQVQCLRCNTCLAGKNSWITLHQKTFTTTEYIIANAPSPPVCFEPAVTVYHRRFQMDPAVMLTYHRRFVIRPGGDVVESITAGSIWNRR